LNERKKNLEYIKEKLAPLESISRDIIFPDDISYNGANILKAFRNHHCGATVEQYYFSRYKAALKYPYLPCIILNGGYNHKYFYPLEYLKEYDTKNDPDFIADQFKNSN
jgi:hypothetical protein